MEYPRSGVRWTIKTEPWSVGSFTTGMVLQDLQEQLQPAVNPLKIEIVAYEVQFSIETRSRIKAI